MTKKLTVATVRADLADVGITIRKNTFGEYRVNFRDGAEATAAYTDDLEDAHGTGLAMARDAAERQIHKRLIRPVAINPQVRAARLYALAMFRHGTIH